MSTDKSIVVVDVPPEARRFNETIRNAGVTTRVRPGNQVSEIQELYTLVYDDITHLFNNEPANALVMIKDGPSRDRYADFGDLQQNEPWRDFADSYQRYSFGMLNELYRKVGANQEKTIVYERHGPNYAVFSIYDEISVRRHYENRDY